MSIVIEDILPITFDLEQMQRKFYTVVYNGEVPAGVFNGFHRERVGSPIPLWVG